MVCVCGVCARVCLVCVCVCVSHVSGGSGVCVCVSHVSGGSGVCVCVSHVSGGSGVCVCAEVTEVFDTMSCLLIVSDRAATEGSKYFELGRQPHEFLT